MPSPINVEASQRATEDTPKQQRRFADSFMPNTLSPVLLLVTHNQSAINPLKAPSNYALN